MITLFIFANLLFISFSVPGLTLFNIIMSHLIGNLWLSVIQISIPSLLLALLMHFVIKKKIYEWAKKKFEKEDPLYNKINKKLSERPIFYTNQIWISFIPINKKIYWLSLNENINFSVYFLPAIPFVAVHSSIFAFIGIFIPDFTKKWLNELSFYRIEEIVLFSVCLTILVGTKLTIIIFYILQSIQRCKKKKEEQEEGKYNCNDDVKTCVSLDVTLESISHIKRMAEFDIKNDQEISLDSIIVPKQVKARDTMSCIGKTAIQKK